GGDGTLCEVLNGVGASDTPVGFIPAGTGNDFTRTVGLSRTAREAARQIIAGRSRRLDLMRLETPAMLSINIIGIGFDAAVAARMNRHTRLGGGALPYLSAVMMELAHMRPVSLRLRVDDELWEGQALLVAIANAQTYGGGMRIAPEACVDDGLLDVVIVEPLGRLEFLRTLPKVFHGTHVAHPAVSCQRGREIAVESDEPVPVMVDGDLKAATPLRVTVAPGAAHLWLPPV
ncbi:MAG: diacylglycerol kinase family lipid kinase, partial [Armatimonadetes bacterium]|nr:diacylglycerol kinase family lipid kinase [Armatimonadota bacterium]